MSIKNKVITYRISHISLLAFLLNCINEWVVWNTFPVSPPVSYTTIIEMIKKPITDILAKWWLYVSWRCWIALEEKWPKSSLVYNILFQGTLNDIMLQLYHYHAMILFCHDLFVSHSSCFYERMNSQTLSKRSSWFIIEEAICLTVVSQIVL